MATWSAFAILQSRLHEIWARFFASSLEDRLRYTGAVCAETFPFPNRYSSNPTLEAAGKEYYEFRASLMIENNEGLTKTYNRFHDPAECSPTILKLRELHAVIDGAVLEAYGWHDLTQKALCEFILDYQDEISEDPSRRERKKPWRYRWPDENRDEVLARLLDLNRVRAAEEAANAISVASAKTVGARTKKTPKSAAPAAQRVLYLEPTE